MPIVGLRRLRLHVFVTSFQRKNDVTPSNAMTYIMMSASACFPRDYKTVNYCLIYHTQVNRIHVSRSRRVLAIGGKH